MSEGANAHAFFDMRGKEIMARDKIRTPWWNTNAAQTAAKYFLLASFVALFGWVFETVSFIVMDISEDRGFLTLPFCYLYGSAVLLVYALIGTPFGKRAGKLFSLLRGERKNPARTFFAVIVQMGAYFAIAAVLATAIELIVGLVCIEWADIPLWSYGSFAHNYRNIVCLEFSLLWGALITVGMCTLWPLFVWLESKLSPKLRVVFALALALLVCTDFIFNCVYCIRTGYHFDLF